MIDWLEALENLRSKLGCLVLVIPVVLVVLVQTSRCASC